MPLTYTRGSTLNVPFVHALDDEGRQVAVFALHPDSPGADGGGGGTPAPDLELALLSFRVKTAFSGGGVGDTVTSMRAYNVTVTPIAQVGDTIWYNENTQAAIAAPPAANLEPLASGGITNAQMAALLAGMATAALQNTAILGLGSIDSGVATINGKVATQATLAAILTKLADPATQATLAAVLAKLPADPATAALQTSTAGTKTTGSAALPAGGSGFIGWLSELVTRVIGLSDRFPTSIGTKAAAASLSVTPASDANVARETYSSVKSLTANAATAAAAFGTQVCSSLDIVNDSSVTIEYLRTGDTVYVPIQAGGSRLVQGITNANQVSIRRKDGNATVIAISAEAFVS